MIRPALIGWCALFGLAGCVDEVMQAVDPTMSTEDDSAGDDGGINCGNGLVDEGEACDDANDNNLDGCTSHCKLGPQVVMLTGDEATEVVGTSTAATPFDDLCGTNRVITGLTGEVAVDGRLNLLGITCRPLALINAAPPALATVLPATMLPTRGSAGNVPFVRDCDEGQAIVGFTARIAAGQVVQLTMQCTALALDTGPTGWTVTPNEPSLLTEAGGNFGEATPVIACRRGWVATGSYIRAEPGIAAFGLRCAQVVVQ